MATRNKTTLSVRELMSYLGIGKTTAYALLKSGNFKVVIVDRQRRVDRESLEEWLASQSHYLAAAVKQTDGNGTRITWERS